MQQEIKELMEEIAKLRERIAVLESAHGYSYKQPPQPVPQYVRIPALSLGTDPIFPPGTITC